MKYNHSMNLSAFQLIEYWLYTAQPFLDGHPQGNGLGSHKEDWQFDRSKNNRKACTIDTRDRVSIDTRDRHLDRSAINTRPTSRLTLGWHMFNFRWHSIEWRSILATTTCSMSVDVSIATVWSAVGSMSVVCQWCIGSTSVMYSSQYPSSNCGILPNTPSAS